MEKEQIKKDLEEKFEFRMKRSEVMPRFYEYLGISK